MSHVHESLTVASAEVADESTPVRAFARLTFTPEVKSAQRRYGTRDAMRRLEQASPNDRLTPELAEYIASLDSFYVGTASRTGGRMSSIAAGQPGS